ncbi:MAG TPA: carbohydrate-binding family 9-like protein [Thermoanaerobaculia bacterium]
MIAPDAPIIPVARVVSPADVAMQPPWTLRGPDGAPARSVETRVRFAATAEHFVVLFESTAEPPLTIERRGGEDVFRDECVELFLCAPHEHFAYREIVVNPSGAVYAARIVNPDDSRQTWNVVAGEPPAGVFIDVRGDPATGPATEWARWNCRLAFPWSSLLPGRAPEAGEERRGNVTRIARGRSTEFLSLSPTLRANPPDFHVPSRFARFVFGAAAAP